MVDAPESGHDPAPDLREHVETSIGRMNWLGPSDSALIALAKRYAEVIETAIDRAEALSDLYDDPAANKAYEKRLQALEAQCEVVRVVVAVGPLLAAVLRDLGGSPSTRKALKPDNPVGGRLAVLRDAAGKSAG